MLKFHGQTSHDMFLDQKDKGIYRMNWFLWVTVPSGMGSVSFFCLAVKLHTTSLSWDQHYLGHIQLFLPCLCAFHFTMDISVLPLCVAGSACWWYGTDVVIKSCLNYFRWQSTQLSWCCSSLQKIIASCYWSVQWVSGADRQERTSVLLLWTMFYRSLCVSYKPAFPGDFSHPAKCVSLYSVFQNTVL